jgi:hypothetical protein
MSQLAPLEIASIATARQSQPRSRLRKQLCLETTPPADLGRRLDPLHSVTASKKTAVRLYWTPSNASQLAAMQSALPGVQPSARLNKKKNATAFPGPPVFTGKEKHDGPFQGPSFCRQPANCYAEHTARHPAGATRLGTVFAGLPRNCTWLYRHTTLICSLPHFMTLFSLLTKESLCLSETQMKSAQELSMETHTTNFHQNSLSSFKVEMWANG